MKKIKNIIIWVLVILFCLGSLTYITNDSIVDNIDKSDGVISDSVTPFPGLETVSFPDTRAGGIYKTGTLELIRSWDELIASSEVTLEDTKLTACSINASDYDLVIPDSVEELSERVFESQEFISITLPEGIIFENDVLPFSSNYSCSLVMYNGSCFDLDFEPLYYCSDFANPFEVINMGDTRDPGLYSCDDGAMAASFDELLSHSNFAIEDGVCKLVSTDFSNFNENLESDGFEIVLPDTIDYFDISVVESGAQRITVPGNVDFYVEVSSYIEVTINMCYNGKLKNLEESNIYKVLFGSSPSVCVLCTNGIYYY